MSPFRQDNWRKLTGDWFASHSHAAGVPPSPEVTLWEDMAFGALKVAEQQRQFVYNPQSAEAVAALLESYGADPEDADPPIDTSDFIVILPAAHTAKALVAPGFLDVLTALGLIADSAWAPHALPTIWRGWANMTVEPPEQTDLFADYLERAARQAPSDMLGQIETLAHFSPDTLSKAETSLLRLGMPTDADNLRKKAADTNALHLEVLLADNWRAERGWLTPVERGHVFCPWFDGLASRMGEALVQHLFPLSDLARRGAPCDARPALN